MINTIYQDIFKHIFLLSDMDGTLLNSKSQVSAINKYALDAFTKAGGTFAVATGRTLNSCRNYLDSLPINAPSIFYNGTILENVHNHTVLKKLCLNDTTIEDNDKIYTFLEQCMLYCPELCIELHTKDTFYIITDKKYDDPIIRREKPICFRVKLTDLKEADLPILKVQFYTKDTKKISWLHNFAKSMEMEKIAKYFISWSYYFELIPKNASKGIMLEQLRQMPIYKDKIFIAVGDYDNDIEMLLRADCAIAAKNATDNVKRVADIVGVSCDEHLLANIISTVIPNLDTQLITNLSNLQSA